MRRLARPTGLSRGYTQRQKDHQNHQHQQRRYSTERQTLSKYPSGILIHRGRVPTRVNHPAVFQLPDRLFDLDAEDSPYVRPYDEEKDGPLQASKWGYDPVVDEIREEAKRLSDENHTLLKAMRTCTNAPLAVERLSDHDIMAVALFKGLFPELDPSKPLKKALSSRLLKLLRKLDDNGVPRADRSHPNKIIPFMLHRQQLTLESLRASSADTIEKELGEVIDKCKDLAELRAVCSRIDTPESGVDMSAASIGRVHGRLLDFLGSGTDRDASKNILEFVNNVTIKRLTANKQLNRSMTLLGLQLASHRRMLSSILQYLQICVSVGFVTDRAEGLSLTRYRTGHAILFALERGDGTTRGTRQQIFTLLTGRGADNTGPQGCLLGLGVVDSAQNPDLFNIYIALLSELGALRLLVHHRRQRAEQLAPGSSSENSDEGFVQAFLRCAQVLGSVEVKGLSVDLTTMTGDIERDAALDWQNINIVDALHAHKGTNIPKPSLAALEGVITASEIIDGFDKPDMPSVMGHLKELVEAASVQAPEGGLDSDAPQHSGRPGEAPHDVGAQVEVFREELPQIENAQVQVK